MNRLILSEPLRTAESQRFLQAWNRWRGEKLLPTRQDVDLRSVASLLPLMIVLEVHSAEEIVFRLAGSQFRIELGFDPTGMNYVALASPGERAARGALLMEEVARPCAAAMTYTHVYPSGYKVDVEIVSVPMAGTRPGAPGQVMALATKLVEARPEPSMGRAPVLPAGHGLFFIDIGCGIPDKAEILGAVEGFSGLLPLQANHG